MPAPPPVAVSCSCFSVFAKHRNNRLNRITLPLSLTRSGSGSLLGEMSEVCLARSKRSLVPYCRPAHPTDPTGRIRPTCGYPPSSRHELHSLGPELAAEAGDGHT